MYFYVRVCILSRYTVSWMKHYRSVRFINVKCKIGLMSRVFANSPGDHCSIPGQVIPKTQKMVLDSALLNTQHYKVRIMDKVEQSREWSSAPPSLQCGSY